jgi:hypothetical protein
MEFYRVLLLASICFAYPVSHMWDEGKQKPKNFIGVWGP